jgi:hypothetical protein
MSLHLTESDEAILQALEELTFSSIQQLARTTHLQDTMVYRRVSEKLVFAGPHLRRVPHGVSGHQKVTRVQCSQSLLATLRTQQTPVWHEIVTLDELQFYYIPNHGLI